MKMSSGSLSNTQLHQVGRFPAPRKAKKVHNNEYNHDMEKHLQAHLNEAEFIPHDSFLKKFSTRTQHGSGLASASAIGTSGAVTSGDVGGSQAQLPFVHSHSSLPMCAIDQIEGDSKPPTKQQQILSSSSSSSKHRCSFKLEEQPPTPEKEDSLEAGLLLGNEADTQSSLIRAAAAVVNTNRQSSSSHLKVNKKKINKSMSITSNVSSASTSHFENQSCFGKLLIKCNYFVFGPDDNPMFVWLIILNVCVLYNIWLIIARQSFEKLQTEYQHYWRVADSIADSVYFIDVVVQFRTGYLEQGLLVYDSKKLALNYIRSKKFLLDLFALTPLELVQLWYGYSIPILRFPRFFKLYRTVELYYITESRTLYPNVWRVANLTHILFCLGHWFAGFYFLISKAEGFKGHWSYPEPVDEFALLSRMYLRSLYWSTLTLTTIGDLPPPETNWQWLKEMSNFRYLFSIAVHYLAVFVIALIVGQVGNVITNRNANRVEFERLLDGAKQYMRNHNVPTEMQKRVQRWYDYSWSRGRMNGSGDIHSIGLLPDKLKTELALHVNLETLRKVTIFQECQPEFLHDLVLKMRASIFTPGDVICRRGEIAREMFIIADGVLEVIGENGDVLTKMYSGDFFGEIGILNIEGASNKRTADVRSVGYAELFSLSKEDVLTAVKDYPEAERILIEYGRRRLNQNMARASSCKGPPSLKITNESISGSKGDSQDNLDNPSPPSSILQLHHHHHHHHANAHARRMSVAKLLSMKERAKFESNSPDSVELCASNEPGNAVVAASGVGAMQGDNRGLTTDMLGLPTLLAKQQAIVSIDPSRIDVQSLINAVLTSDKVGEREKWLEIELINASICKTADNQKIVDTLEQISNMCLNEEYVNINDVVEQINKLRDEVDNKKDSKYDNFFQLVEQKDAKIKLLESRIKILQKYLTQRDVLS